MRAVGRSLVSEAAVEVMCRDNDLRVRHMVHAAAAEAGRLMTLPRDSGAANLIEVLDRITAVAALGLDVRQSDLVDMGAQALLDVYGSTVDDTCVHHSAHRLGPGLWLRVAERLYSLGALAVRLHDRAAVRALAVASARTLEREQREPSWSSLLVSARAAADADPLLRPDLPGEASARCGDQDPLWDSLCQFSFVVAAVTGVAPDDLDMRALAAVSRPDMARADGGRAHLVA